MKFEDHKLQRVLRQQRESVILVDTDGNERHGISARWAAEYVLGRQFIGHAKNGIVTCVRAADALRQRAFIISRELSAVMAAFPRLSSVKKNQQSAGAKRWSAQPAFSNTGHAGKVETVHFYRSVSSDQTIET